MEGKRLSIVAVIIVLMLASLSHAVEVKLTPGQKLSLTDGSYLTLQGAQIAHVAAAGKIKTFPQGATIKCDHSGHVSIWGTGGTNIWGAGGTAITNSELCRKIAHSGQMQGGNPSQKFEDPTFRKGFDDPLFKPIAPASAGGRVNPQATPQADSKVGRAGAIIEPDILRRPKFEDPTFQPKAPTPGNGDNTNPQPAKLDGL